LSTVVKRLGQIEGIYPSLKLDILNLPRIIDMDFDWTQEFSANSTLGNQVITNFRLNSLYDPETTTGTPYPPGFVAVNSLY